MCAPRGGSRTKPRPRADSSRWSTCATPNDRDAADATLGRATRPEDAAADALVLDTSDLTAEEVIDVIVTEARARRATFYRFARAVVLSLFKVIFRVRVVGMENVPPWACTSWRRRTAPTSTYPSPRS